MNKIIRYIPNYPRISATRTLSVIAVLIFSVFTQHGYAIDESIYLDTVWYKQGNIAPTCVEGSATTSAPTGLKNLDYKGNTILNDTQLQAISENQATYEKAASQVGIPWQMLAVVHLRETNLRRANPSNGQGIYQFYNKQGGPYPTGDVSDAEFLRQTILAAEFLKNKAESNYEGNKDLNAQSSAEVIKDTFFGYNGRAGVYEDQAKSLGFTRDNQGYEGSPYVMNVADAIRDPEVAKDGTWGQIKTDGGGISYPANSDYGAFVVFASMAGIATGAGSCNSIISGPVREQVVALARQELALWENNTLKPGDDYQKYTVGQSGDWCAWFASWIYKEAGYPLTDTESGAVPRVREIRAIGEENILFTFHLNDGSYTPVPGDMVIQSGHVNIVVAVNGEKITVIGGNQSGTNGFTTSKVTEYTMPITYSDNLGFVSPKE